MTPLEFIAKWKRANLSERSAAQQHFLDLCDMLGQPKPAAADPEGSWYTFERGVHKTGGGEGWADVWLKEHFAWEYKRKRRSLAEAYQQLLLYREDLENPPLLVVCDLERFEIHTNFTGTPTKVYAFDLDGLAEPSNLDALRKVFTDPEALKPGETRERITQEAANRFARLAEGMRQRGVAAQDAAHFLMKLMFCMFAEDIDLLPDKLFSRLLVKARNDPAKVTSRLRNLFQPMARGGDFGDETIQWFNGGLFADADVVELTGGEIEELTRVSGYDWGSVEPSIFGTLFERTLDPAKRSQIGAHYTSKDDILTLLEPVVMTPLRREWTAVREDCQKLRGRIREQARSGRGPRRTVSKERKQFDAKLLDFVQRLSEVKVLDPACGSGNFLYVAINLLLSLEKEVIAYAANNDTAIAPHVSPSQLLGIEINEYAQQLAQVVIWIGHLQWKHQNGFAPPHDPVLQPIENIRRMDAILDLSDPKNPKEPDWPAADFIVGNPPFLGGNKIRAELGDEYVGALFKTYEGRLSAFSDLCCYWFEKARAEIESRRVGRAGLLATQGIRGGVNREALKRIKQTGNIFFAESDRDWILDGASVHVSMVGFDDGAETERTLDGHRVAEINANLTSTSDLTLAKRLPKNVDLWCYGSQQKARFDVDFDVGLSMLGAPNPDGKPNSDVIRLSLNGAQILRRTAATFVIDFGLEEDVEKAAQYEMPFEYVKEHIWPIRQQRREVRQQRYWWLHARPSPRYRHAMVQLPRHIVTPVVSKHRVFVWMDNGHLVDHATVVFLRDEDWFFGLLHSRLHELWARQLATQVRERESGLRYTATSCFETFPLPGAEPGALNRIAAASRELVALRDGWLNPPDWTRVEHLEFPGSAAGPWRQYVQGADARGIGTVRYPRLVAKDENSAKQLAKRTLTNLYNQRPTWLDNAHRKLDEAVFAAYAWGPALSDEEILQRLLDLNLARAADNGISPDQEEATVEADED